ncbi:hypothetical protein QFC22_000812 [Naganishia vaughanmartiniae]|uniref:Uncharacterized protein n=1 Tax=Naganishia vaughanmartiniae TaxID=1424756 RepID=A0ACC2XKW3_9TREE|nr:hypothetical protein QFC22_000812 [Naganishia vaughanmartiniae]
MSHRERPPRASRSRSPAAHSDRDRRRPEFGRPRDNGYQQRDAERRRNDLRDDGRPSVGRPRDTPYTADDRQKERNRDRQRYEDGNGDGSRSPERAKSPPKPNFGNSGLLAAESNTVKVSSDKASKAGTPDVTGVVLKYHEPPEARKPTKSWRLYVFKGKEQVELIQIHKQSAYLVGRDRIVSDIPIDHPSASKQHAVIQYRQIIDRNEFGDTKTTIKPFIIDLESTNGTFVNGQEIPVSRYYELKQSDVIKFGESSREYVLLHEESA